MCIRDRPDIEVNTRINNQYHQQTKTQKPTPTEVTATTLKTTTPPTAMKSALNKGELII